MVKKYFILFALLFSFSSVLYAQSAHKNIKTGVKLLNKNNFREALPYFEAALQQESDNPFARYYAGICHLNNYSNKIGLAYIEQAYKEEPKLDPFVHYWLGRAYHYNYEYKKAIKSYNQFSKTIDKRSPFYTDVKKLIKEANHGIELQRKPGKYYIESLGDNINTPYSEHSPIISSNADRLIFTSRHEGTTGKKKSTGGDYFEDIVQVSLVNGGDEKAENIAGLNSSKHESNIQLFDNDSKMLLYKFSNGGDLYVAERDGNGWSKPHSISNKINSKYYESHGFISEDGKTIYFSSNNGRKKGDLDLFVSKKDESGNWQTPKSLGLAINSDYDEDSPFLTADGKTLYFSSNGHESSGGFDIFKSVYDESSQKWSPPEHLGYPINTPGDDVYFTLHPSGAYGFISSDRAGGKGGMDIYKIGIKQDMAVKGTVTTTNGGKAVAGVKLIWQELKFKENYITESDSEGNYEVTLPSQAKYKLVTKYEGKEVAIKDNSKLELSLVKEPGQTMERNIAVDVDIKNDKGEKTKTVQFAGTINSDEKIENATVTIRDKETGEIIAKTKLNDQNKYNLNLQVAEGHEYTVDVVSDGVSYNNIAKIDANNYTKDASSSRNVKLDVKLKELSAGKKFVLKSLYFDLNSSVINPNSKKTLEQLFKMLNDNPSMSLEISGHTDNIGDYNYNVWLSEKRAKKVANYLTKKGISKDRLPFRGYGPDKPIASNDDEKDGRELNRRTEIKILKL